MYRRMWERLLHHSRVRLCNCAFSQHLLHSRKIIKSIYYRCYNKNDNDEIKNKKKKIDAD